MSHLDAAGSISRQKSRDNYQLRRIILECGMSIRAEWVGLRQLQPTLSLGGIIWLAEQRHAVWPFSSEFRVSKPNHAPIGQGVLVPSYDHLPFSGVIVTFPALFGIFAPLFNYSGRTPWTWIEERPVQVSNRKVPEERDRRYFGHFDSIPCLRYLCVGLIYVGRYLEGLRLIFWSVGFSLAE